MPAGDRSTGPVPVPASDHPIPRDPASPPGSDDLADVVDRLTSAPGSEDVGDDGGDARPEDGAEEPAS